MHHPKAPITLAIRRRSRRLRRGFTMLELLVVIGIILVLVAMGVIGMQGIAESGNRNQTRTALSNAASMLAEYEAKASFGRQPPIMWKGNRSAPTLHEVATDGPIDIWRDYDPDTAGFQGLQTATDVAPYPPTTTVAEQRQRTDSAAVRNTLVVFAQVAGVPAAKAMLRQIPPEQVLKTQDDPGTPIDEGTTPVLLDGWSNPIIFVPSSGLRGVFLDDATLEYVITSAKAYPVADLPDGTTAPSSRPFFASAGPDGDFSKGDDNLYSFGN